MGRPNVGKSSLVSVTQVQDAEGIRDPATALPPQNNKHGVDDRAEELHGKNSKSTKKASSYLPRLHSKQKAAATVQLTVQFRYFECRNMRNALIISYQRARCNLTRAGRAARVGLASSSGASWSRGRTRLSGHHDPLRQKHSRTSPSCIVNRKNLLEMHIGRTRRVTEIFHIHKNFPGAERLNTMMRSRYGEEQGDETGADQKPTRGERLDVASVMYVSPWGLVCAA